MLRTGDRKRNRQWTWPAAPRVLVGLRSVSEVASAKPELLYLRSTRGHWNHRASTLVDLEGAWIQSFEKAATEVDELIENGDWSGARRLLLAELAAGDGFAWLISTIDNEGVRQGTEVDLTDGDYIRGHLAIHCCANGDEVCCDRVKTSDTSGYLSDKLSPEIRAHRMELIAGTKHVEGFRHVCLGARDMMAQALKIMMDSGLLAMRALCAARRMDQGTRSCKVMRRTFSWMGCLRYHRVHQRYQRQLRSRENMRNMVCVGTELAKQTSLGWSRSLVESCDLSVFQPIEGELEHGSFDDSCGFGG